MDKQIDDVRQIALEMLKPTPAELQHGLELHGQSLVIDAYGFSPVPPADGEAVRAAVEAGASPQEVRDVLEDSTMTRIVTDPVERELSRRAWEAAGVTCIVQNAGEEGQSVRRLLKRLARFTYTVDMTRDLYQRATRPEDISAAHRAGKRCLYFSGNGVPLPEDWNCMAEELGAIRLFFQLGIRMMHLTYNRRNMIGDGCAEPANAGLSDFGRAVVAEMNRVGVIVDVAHAGWQTSLEAAQRSARPMVASHSGCAALNAHVRCKPDAVIRAIADTGGFIGICGVPAFLGRSGDIRAFLDHLDHVIRRFGAEHAAIGTDEAYLSPNRAAEERKMPPRKARATWENFWPPNDPVMAPAWNTPAQRRSLAWTNWPLFTVGLVQRGHSDDAIRKVLGLNVLRVAQAAMD